MRQICVFCGSKEGASASYKAAAELLASELASRKLTLVYGGGRVGLMGAIADAMLKYGGAAIGVLPRFLQDRELGHTGLTKLILVDSMHQRKQKMSELADGFIAMPGGFGTLEELCEILTWRQLQLVEKPIGLLNVDGFFDPLVGFFDRMIGQDFLRQEHKDLLFVEDKPEKLLDRFEEFAISFQQGMDKT